MVGGENRIENALALSTPKNQTLINTGKTADILIINGRPDRIVGDTRKIEVVIKAGKVIDRKKLRFDANPDVGFQVFSPSAWK